VGEQVPRETRVALGGVLGNCQCPLSLSETRHCLSYASCRLQLDMPNGRFPCHGQDGHEFGKWNCRQKWILPRQVDMPPHQDLPVGSEVAAGRLGINRQAGGGRNLGILLAPNPPVETKPACWFKTCRLAPNLPVVTKTCLLVQILLLPQNLLHPNPLITAKPVHD
jgi:hypothetical protein